MLQRLVADERAEEWEGLPTLEAVCVDVLARDIGKGKAGVDCALRFADEDVVCEASGASDEA